MQRVLSGVVSLLSVLGPEVETAPPVRGMDARPHYQAVAAANGAGQWLVAYDVQDDNDTGVSTGDNLRFTRVAPDGTVLDPGGIEIAIAGPSREQTALASDGTDYVAVWAESLTYQTSELHVARIAADGTILLAPQVLSHIDGLAHNSPHLCYDGDGYRLVFATNDANTGATMAYAATLTRAGALLGAPAALPVTAGAYILRPTVACIGGDSVAGWLEWATAAYDARTSAWPAGGAPGPAQSIALPGALQTQSLALAAGPAGYLAMWDEQRSAGGALALVGQVLTASGARTAAADIPLAAAASTGHAPQVAFDGTAWRVLSLPAVSGQNQVLTTTVAADGTIARAAAPLTSGEPSAPTGVACAGASCLAVWTGGAGSALHVKASRLGPANEALDAPPFPVALPSDEQGSFQVAWDGAQLLAAWIDAPPGGSRTLVVRRQRGDGGWIDAAPLAVGVAQPYGVLAAALPEGGFALTYTRGSTQVSNATDVVTAFVSRAGAISAPATVFTSTSVPTLRQMTCNDAECHVFVDRPSTSDRVAYRIDHQGGALAAQPTALSCDTILAVGAETWCLAQTTARVGPSSAMVLQRADRSLAPLGTPLMLPTPNEKLQNALVGLAEADGVTLIWDTLYLDATTQAQSVRVKVARVGLDGATVLSPPGDLAIGSIGWIAPRALINAKGATRLFWWANDGQTYYHLRTQPFATDDLALYGPLDELTTAGLMLTGGAAVPTVNDDVVVGYLVLDTAPDRGSHRLKLRATVGAPPPDADAGAVSDAAPADAGAAVDAGGGLPDAGVAADAGPAVADAAVDAVDAGAPRDAAAADAAVSDARVSDASVERDAAAPADAGAPDAGRDAAADRAETAAKSGCGCRFDDGGAPAPGAVALLALAALLRRRRAR
jgi:MYXO-CTERM domain-containing protein